MTCASDFTGIGPYLAAALTSMVAFMIGLAMFSFFFPGIHLTLIHKLIAGVMVMIFSFYIVYDTQMMIGNAFGASHEFEVDDYVFAALNVYLDILNLFLYLLQLFGNRDD